MTVLMDGPTVLSVCRDVGPVQGLRQMFFGHASKAPSPAALRRFNPECDVKPGVTVALRISDEDANAWARVFDVGLVLEVLQPGEGSDYDVLHFRVQLYACRGVVEDCDPGSPQMRTEEVQLNMPWDLTVQEHVIPWTAVINEQWVGREGYLWHEWREALRRELHRLHSDDPGDL